ncbi:ABC transporter substrate-binding protein [Candidatus Berkiella aquae]|uniref:Branched-chain amino acid ABC transporter substrate-binding protein n=1 Tax=Candidatus Berkiella aquae TaxID=295108 RepID=A0A0Q9Z256_9GAMM|nr:branched-chain amino acid ABC transporter substrate-binding protein [Candidatus Berkiella aquae]MCS5712072.1 branched-chain amino acid ABC transporter substrate-binding protein [Candidatus Berkiella aquae]
MYKSLTQFFIIILTLLFCRLATAEPIKIGIAGPFSGPYAGMGDQQWLGANQAIEDINAQGGINGNKLMLVIADDDCNPEKAEKIAHHFAMQGDIKAVIGHNCSSTSLAAAKIYAAHNILMITPASTAPALTEQGYHNIFRTCGKNDTQGEFAANFIHDHFDAKKVIIIHDNTLYGKGLADSVQATLTKLGTKVILNQNFQRDNSDYLSLAKTVADMKPDAVFFGGLFTDAGEFLKLLHEINNHIPFIAGDGIASPDFVKAAGGPNITKGVYMTFFSDPNSFTQAKNVVKKFEKKRIKPTGYMLNAYAATQAVAQAIKETSLQKEISMDKWLHENKVDSVIGTLEWDKNGDLKQAPFSVYQWDDEGGYEVYQ